MVLPSSCQRSWCILVCLMWWCVFCSHRSEPDSGWRVSNGWALNHFFQIVFLRYNSHTMKFTFKKSKIQWLLGYSQNCVIIVTNSRIFSSPLQKTPYSSTATLQLPFLHALAITYVLSVSIYLSLLDVSYTWSNIVRGSLCLAFTQHEVFMLKHVSVLHSFND